MHDQDPNNVIISLDNSNANKNTNDLDDFNQYYKYVQQQQQLQQQQQQIQQQIQQQQIWVPREEMMSPTQQMSHYNTQHHHHHHHTAIIPKPQPTPQQNLTLCNGKELPSDLQNINPAFTIRRHIIQIQEEQKQIETLKKSIETKLKIQLPATNSIEELGVALSDGVVLCHLMNSIFPRAIQIIHVPSLPVVS